MERRNFAQVLKSAKLDIAREYERLYLMFNLSHKNTVSFRELCEENFERLPFKGTCISLEDFDDYYGFRFEESPCGFDVNYLVNFCEYVYNLAMYNTFDNPVSLEYSALDLITQIDKVIELIGYMSINQDGFTVFVPKSQPAIVVSEMLPEKLSYKVIEYNHHSMKGDLERKSATLKLLADQLESKEDELHGLNKQFKSDIFYLFNNINIRHNNIEKLKGIEENKLEEWYDYTYELTLQAFMMLENSNHKQAVCDIKKELGDV